MPYWSLSWHAAAALALALLAAAVVLRTGRVRHSSPRAATAAPALRELGIVFALFALWQLAGAHAHTRVAGAEARALDVWHAERWLHLPDEVRMQHAVLPHHFVIQRLNDYYAGAHLSGMLVFLVWLLWRHREVYAPVRNMVVALTGVSLLIQMVPVAPPRMFPQLGFVDSALLWGQSVYGSMDAGIPTQLAAMPSLHVGWAVLIAAVVVSVSTSRWRWLVVLHPVATVAAVVLTANHWWLDGVAAVGLLALLWGVRRLALAVVPVHRLSVARPVIAVAMARSAPANGAADQQ